jgi:hypothetical protein
MIIGSVCSFVWFVALVVHLLHLPLHVPCLAHALTIVGMKYAQLVIGPAGSGKSTYCAAMARHGEAIGWKISVVNLDPAAEHFDYNPIVDVRDLITSADVMQDQELRMGPNGALIFAMEYLVQNEDWIEENFADYDEEYIVFDCPGQIELYAYLNVMNKLVQHLTRFDFRMCAVFVMDCTFASDRSKFFSGILVSLSTLINLELPFINILSKTDLLTEREKQQLEQMLEPHVDLLLEDKRLDTPDDRDWPQFAALTVALGRLIDDYSLVKFYTLNLEEEDSISDILLVIDNAIQFGEDADVRIPRDNDVEE